ncbi:MAG: transcriptional regulator [Candidatus Bathyarchaeia archaeon]
MPSINARIAMELIEKHGMKRSEVAKKMGITPAAVTQYLNSLRGDAAMNLIERSEEAVKIIEKIASDLANGKPSNDVIENICTVCHAIRSSGLICKIHKDMMPSLKGRNECEIPPELCHLLKRISTKTKLQEKGGKQEFI